MKNLPLFLLLMFGFLSNAQNSFIYKKSGEKLAINDWRVFPNGPKSKFPHNLFQPGEVLTPDNVELNLGADLMPMKEIDSVTGHGKTYKPYTLKGEKYIFLATVLAESQDHTLLLGYHRRGSQLHHRSFDFKFVDNKTNEVVEDYIYKDYAGEDEMEEQEKVFAGAKKYFGNCAEFMKVVEDCKKAANNNSKNYDDRFKLSFLPRSFNCK